MRKVELGIFMPIASNGFIFSKRAPHYHPTFDLHRQIALLAEDIGLDYLFWMGKWLGYGGPTHHWEQSLEPITLASAIAASTQRLKLYATINPLLFHPTVAAKMIATIDDVSNGRFGINIVTGNTLDEYHQMGIVPEGYNQNRYQYAEEWTSVLKALWTQEKVTFKGRFFNLVDCVSDPKPRQKPYPPIISAGLSDEGLRFGAKHSDYAFMGLRAEEIARTRAFAREYGRSVKVATNLFLLPRATDEEAMTELRLLREELDHEALDNLIASTERDMRDAKRADWLRAPTVIGFGNGAPVPGSPDTIARKLAKIIVDSDVDALQFTFLDFPNDLAVFRDKIGPILKELLRQNDVQVGLRDLHATAA
jgi:pyrimidine oxygenase